MSGMLQLALMGCALVNVLAWSRLATVSDGNPRVLGWGILACAAMWTMGYVSGIGSVTP